MDAKQIGKHGEDIACIYLKEKGHAIILRNYTCKIGEIDIISRFGDTVYVSEVKTRTGVKYGYPYESVNYKKKEKIFNVYRNYCLERNIETYKMIFSIISISIDKNSEIDIEFFEDIWG